MNNVENHQNSLKCRIPNKSDKNHTLSQTQMAKMLNATEQTISDLLWERFNFGKWVPHKLNDRQMGNKKKLL